MLTRVHTYKKLWVIMPVFNEEESIQHVIQEWFPVLRNCTKENFIFCVLNDGSTDNTLEILRRLEVIHPELYVVDKKNSGHGQTCVEGYFIALNQGAEWIFQIDSDGQCDPVYFKSFWNFKDQYPIIYGQRISREDGLQRLLISKIVSFVVWLSTGFFVRDANVPYRLMHRDTLHSILHRIPKDFKLANILLSAMHQKKHKIFWIPIHFRNRLGGNPSVKIISFAKHGLLLYRQLQNCK